MDQPLIHIVQGDHTIGLGFTAISIATGLFAFIPPNIDLWIRCIAGAIAAMSGIAAITYYIYAIVEKRLTIKKLKQDDRNNKPAN